MSPVKAPELSDRDRELFELPADVAYLNTANIGPRLAAVSEAGNRAIELFARPWEITSDEWFSHPERLREEFAGFVGVGSDSIALIPSVSYGIAVAARNLPIDEGSTIVVVEEQYPSNIYAWRRRAHEAGAEILVAERAKERPLTESVVGLCDERTAVVAVPNCHWTDGELIDLETVGRTARAAGAALVVDASQSLGALPLDFAAVAPDFVVTVGYKWLLGPYGLGYLYADEKWHDRGIPIEETWLTRRGSEDFGRLIEYVDDYRPGARRFDFGEYPQFINVPMARAALRQLSEWGPAHIQSKLRNRTSAIREICEQLGLGTLPAHRSADHMLGIELPATCSPEELDRALRAERVHASIRGDKLRVAPHLHNDRGDLDRFASVLGAALG